MRRVLSVALGFVTVLATASPASGASSADDNLLSPLADPPEKPTTEVEQSGNTLIVSAGAPGTLTITESPGGGWSGPTIYCGWFDLVIGETSGNIAIVNATDPVVGDNYVLICWTASPVEPISGYPIVVTFPGPATIPGPAVSTGEAAQYAVNSIVFEWPAAELSPGSQQIVGIPSWLAVTSRLHYDPVSAEAGPVWATVRPEFRDATWDLGNGDIRTCVGDATTTWNLHGPTTQTSACTYTYEKVSGDTPYAAGVTINWTIYQLTDKSAGAWEVWGTISLTTSLSIDVGQLQATIR